MTTQPSPPPVVWWIIWAAIVGGLTVIYAVLPSPDVEQTGEMFRYLPMIPLAVSTAIRWMVLPRFEEGAKAFTFFIVGLALAEASGIIALVLVPALREIYFTLALLGLGQFAPMFASNFRK